MSRDLAPAFGLRAFLLRFLVSKRTAQPSLLEGQYNTWDGGGAPRSRSRNGRASSRQRSLPNPATVRWPEVEKMPYRRFGTRRRQSPIRIAETGAARSLAPLDAVANAVANPVAAKRPFGAQSAPRVSAAFRFAWRSLSRSTRTRRSESRARSRRKRRNKERERTKSNIRRNKDRRKRAQAEAQTRAKARERAAGI